MIYKGSLFVKNNRDRSYNGVFLKKKQIGVILRWMQPINSKLISIPPVKIIEKKKKAAKIQRLTNNEQT